MSQRSLAVLAQPFTMRVVLVSWALHIDCWDCVRYARGTDQKGDNELECSACSLDYTGGIDYPCNSSSFHRFAFIRDCFRCDYMKLLRLSLAGQLSPRLFALSLHSSKSTWVCFSPTLSDCDKLRH